MIMVFYGVFVALQLTMADDTLLSYKLAVDVTDITVGSILLLEILLKLDAGSYCCDGNDVKPRGQDIETASDDTRLRVLVVFERVKQRFKSMNLMHINKEAITSPMELILRILNELRFHSAIRPSLRDGVDFAIHAIKNNRLYDANALLTVDGVDSDTQNWLRGEMLIRKYLGNVSSDAETDDELGSPNRKRQRSWTASSCSDVDDAADVADGSSDGSAAAGSKPPSLHRHHYRHSPSHANGGAIMQDLYPTLNSASEFELQKLLQDVSLWDFDVFQVHGVSGGNALYYIGQHLLGGGSCQALNIENNVLVNFLLEIQRGYTSTNPYHNAIHAADVMQTVHYFLIQPELAPYLRPLDRAVSLIAAGMHDFMHDGFNNSFHISTASEIALRYNDNAVLENYHVAQSFLVMKNADRNVLGQLAPDDFKYARDMIIQMVLATDMAKHFEDVALFKANILSAALDESAVLIKDVGDKKLLLKMILHTCDVSNPAKERKTMLRWTDRVVKEFFIQGDMEKQLGLPVSPFMDRDIIVLKKMQVGFADFIVSPLFSVWAQILVNVNAGAYRALLSNREFWSSVSDDFKPHMIKEVIRELEAQRQCDTQTQNTIREEQMLLRSRRSVMSILLETDDG
ncbi:unnamed protein product [Peronospora destructor]|uniref:Phosphodiesterase n=1 Tax=Peronospora destructor TaxID=86335 RepID=A0AAV0UH84_9STRA|nr:unnamed protein product [Peronospora destructor]